MLTRFKRVFVAPLIAAIAFVSFSSFSEAESKAAAVKCVGSTGYCRITLPDGTVAESTGNVEVTQSL